MHEGTKVVKINKLQQLTYRFKSIRMADDDTFNKFYAKLNDIVNSAFNLVEVNMFYAKLNDIVNSTFNSGEVYEEPKSVRKILRSLIEDFRPMVTAIIENKDVNTIPVDELVGSLQTYESGLPKTNKSKSMVLKLVDDVDENVFDDEISSSEVEYLAKQFRNFLKNNNKMTRNKNFADH